MTKGEKRELESYREELGLERRGRWELIDFLKSKHPRIWLEFNELKLEAIIWAKGDRK